MEKIKKLMYQAKALNVILLILIPLLLFCTGCEQPDKGPVAVSSITISNELETNAIGFEEGKTFKLTADIQPDNATDKTVKWASSNPDIASVSDNGTVTIKSVGSVTITAEAGEKSASDTFVFYEEEDRGYYVDENETKKTYYIWNESGLLEWNAYVTADGKYSDTERLQTSAVLIANISLDKDWAPVGYYDYGTGMQYCYAGTFDGGGHTISNLEIISADSDYLGLFGLIAYTGAVKNLTLSDVEISGNYYIGGIAGRNYGTIENCSVSGSISGTTYVSGIVGDNYGSISDCANNKGNVSGSGNYIGGVTGYNMGTITACYNTGNVSGSDNRNGGIAGYNYDGTISDCYNSGDVSGDENIGGIAGCNNGRIENCQTSGIVYGSFNAGGIVGENLKTISVCNNTGDVSGSNYIGGIAGYNIGTIENSQASGSVSGIRYTGGIVGGNQGTITACRNTGDVSADITKSESIGGITGNNDGSITNCCNTGNISGAASIGGVAGYSIGAITGCYNTGNVSGSRDNIGGVIGFYDDGTISDCYNTGNISGAASIGGVAGYSIGAITGCYNTGSVSGSGNYIGGITGFNDYGTISDCYNIGEVFSESGGYIGGIAGYNSGQISACYNIGEVSSESGGHIGGIAGYNLDTVSACYNIGEISGTERVGGIAGESLGIITACYNTGNISGTESEWVGGIVGVQDSSSGMTEYCYWSGETPNGIGNDPEPFSVKEVGPNGVT